MLYPSWIPSFNSRFLPHSLFFLKPCQLLGGRGFLPHKTYVLFESQCLAPQLHLVPLLDLIFFRFSEIQNFLLPRGFCTFRSIRLWFSVCTPFQTSSLKGLSQPVFTQASLPYIWGHLICFYSFLVDFLFSLLPDLPFKIHDLV